jgi:hypothetical protein
VTWHRMAYDFDPFDRRRTQEQSRDLTSPRGFQLEMIDEIPSSSSAGFCSSSVATLFLSSSHKSLYFRVLSTSRQIPLITSHISSVHLYSLANKKRG